MALLEPNGYDIIFGTGDVILEGTISGPYRAHLDYMLNESKLSETLTARLSTTVTEAPKNESDASI